MSKLDNIILECANKVLAGKEEKLGDYTDPTKEQIKDLFLELIQECKWYESKDGVLKHAFIEGRELSQKVEEL